MAIKQNECISSFNMLQDYEFLKLISFNERYFALGVNKELSSPYVTWECREYDDCINERYFANKFQAINDLYYRAYDYLDHIFNIDLSDAKLEDCSTCDQ